MKLTNALQVSGYGAPHVLWPFPEFQRPRALPDRTHAHVVCIRSGAVPPQRTRAYRRCAGPVLSQGVASLQNGCPVTVPEQSFPGLGKRRNKRHKLLSGGMFRLRASVILPLNLICTLYFFLFSRILHVAPFFSSLLPCRSLYACARAFRQNIVTQCYSRQFAWWTWYHGNDWNYHYFCDRRGKGACMCTC